jgi:hypothetical protein
VPVVLVLVVLSWLQANNFTGGALADRFSDTTLTHRDELIYDDWLIFLENPVLGAGPGLGQSARMGMVAHTEFSRMFSEHGSFGFAALLLMLWMAVTRVQQAGSSLERAYVASMLVWGFLYMMVNGMRLAAPSLVFGLAFIRITPGSEIPRRHGMFFR